MSFWKSGNANFLLKNDRIKKIFVFSDVSITISETKIKHSVDVVIAKSENCTVPYMGQL